MDNALDNIKYDDYLYFSPDEATAWVLDVAKYYTEVKHKTQIPFSEYAQLVKSFKNHLKESKIKLISNHMLLNEEDLQYDDFVEKIWGVPSILTNIDGDTTYLIPEALTSKLPKQFYYDFFDRLVQKENVTIVLTDYTLVKLIKYDITEIRNVYNGTYIYPEGLAPKFYLNTVGKGDTLKYVHKFINEKVLAETEDVIMWDIVHNQTNKCVALVHLQVDKQNKVANMDVVLQNDHSNNEFAQVLKFIKQICFRKLELDKICAVNNNMSFAYSALNTLYHFAGFKANYDIDHSQFEATPDEYPTLDDIYNEHEDVIDKVVIDI